MTSQPLSQADRHYMYQEFEMDEDEAEHAAAAGLYRQTGAGGGERERDRSHRYNSVADLLESISKEKKYDHYRVSEAPLKPAAGEGGERNMSRVVRVRLGEAALAGPFGGAAAAATAAAAGGPRDAMRVSLLDVDDFDRIVLGWSGFSQDEDGLRQPQQAQALGQHQQAHPPQEPQRAEATGRDWNEEYQTLLELPIQFEFDRLRAISRMTQLLSEFTEVGERCANTIVREIALPVTEKSIKPLGYQAGLAGGVKFVHEGIFFKFATSDRHGLYQGSEYYAAKAAKNEIRAMNNVIECGISELHTTLTALFTVKGHALVATALAPISSASLVYGSDDAGATVRDSDPLVRTLMKQLGSKLGLKPHLVAPFSEAKTSAAKEMHIAGDVEGHISMEDSRVYLIDLGRTMPPVPPVPSIPCGHLFQQFRPEFVGAFSKALSADAYTGWGRIDARENHEEIEQAFAHLKSVVIPQFCNRLDALHEEAGVVTLDGEVLESGVVPEDAPATADFRLRDLMHTAGINCRYAGEILSRVSSTTTKLVILRDMVIRCLKIRFHKIIRHAVATTTEEPRLLLLAKTFLLLTLAKAEHVAAVNVLWREVLPTDLQHKFGVDVEPEELEALQAHVANLQHQVESDADYYTASQQLFFTKLIEKMGWDMTTNRVDRCMRDVMNLNSLFPPTLKQRVDAFIVKVPPFAIRTQAELEAELALREGALGQQSMGLMATLKALTSTYASKAAANPALAKRASACVERMLQLHKDYEVALSAAAERPLSGAEVESASKYPQVSRTALVVYAADVMASLGDEERSVALLEEALQVAKERYELDSPTVAHVKHKLAHILVAAHRSEMELERAREHLHDVFKFFASEQDAARLTEHGNPVHEVNWRLYGPGVVPALSTHARLLLLRLPRTDGDNDKNDENDDDSLEAAVETLRIAQEILFRALGSHHPLLASVESLLGTLLERLGELDEAVALFNKSAQVAKVAFGSEHVSVARSMYSHARALVESTRPACQALAEARLAVLEQRETERLAQAEATWEAKKQTQVFAAGRSALKGSHVKELTPRVNPKARKKTIKVGAGGSGKKPPAEPLCVGLAPPQRLEKAVELLNGALPIFETATGPHGPETRNALFVAALALAGLLRWDEARIFAERAAQADAAGCNSEMGDRIGQLIDDIDQQNAKAVEEQAAPAVVDQEHFLGGGGAGAQITVVDKLFSAAVGGYGASSGVGGVGGIGGGGDGVIAESKTKSKSNNYDYIVDTQGVLHGSEDLALGNEPAAASKCCVIL